jgi:hypothetical protein
MVKRLFTSLLMVALWLALLPPSPVTAQQPDPTWVARGKGYEVVAYFEQPDFAPCQNLHLRVFAHSGESRPSHQVSFDFHSASAGVAIYDYCQEVYLLMVGLHSNFQNPVLEIDPALNHARLRTDLRIPAFSPEQNERLLSLDIQWEGYGKKDVSVLHNRNKTSLSCHNIVTNFQGKARLARAWGWVSLDDIETYLQPVTDAQMLYSSGVNIFVKCN